jgi:hypothetical protein
MMHHYSQFSSAILKGQRRRKEEESINKNAVFRIQWNGTVIRRNGLLKNLENILDEACIACIDLLHFTLYP